MGKRVEMAINIVGLLIAWGFIVLFLSLMLEPKPPDPYITTTSMPEFEMDRTIVIPPAMMTFELDTTTENDPVPADIVLQLPDEWYQGGCFDYRISGVECVCEESK